MCSRSGSQPVVLVAPVVHGHAVGQRRHRRPQRVVRGRDEHLVALVEERLHDHRDELGDTVAQVDVVDVDHREARLGLVAGHDRATSAQDAARSRCTRARAGSPRSRPGRSGAEPRSRTPPGCPCGASARGSPRPRAAPTSSSADRGSRTGRSSAWTTGPAGAGACRQGIRAPLSDAESGPGRNEAFTGGRACPKHPVPSVIGHGHRDVYSTGHSAVRVLPEPARPDLLRSSPAKGTSLTRPLTRALALAAALTVSVGLTGCGSKTDDTSGAAASGGTGGASASTPRATRSRSACSTRCPARWRSARSRSATRSTWRSTRSTPPAACWARRSIPVGEDGASDWPIFAEKAQKLISEDKVAAVFGGWTSASRKAMLPVFERNKALLFYPVQYEGLEASPYIFYTGATTNQQIIPGAGLPEGARARRRSSWSAPTTSSRAPPTRRSRPTPTANGIEIVGEEYAPLGNTEFAHDRQQGQGLRRRRRLQHPQRRQQRRLLQAVQERRPDRRRRCRWSRCRSPRRRSRHRHREPRGPAHRLELLPDDRRARRTRSSSRPSRPSTATTRSPATRWRPPTRRSTCGRRMVEKAKSFGVDGRQGGRRRRHLRRPGGHGHDRRRQPPHLQDRPDRQDRRRRPDHRRSGTPASRSSRTRSSRATPGPRACPDVLTT